MNKKTILHIIEWSIAGAAYVYLVYRLVTYDQYDVVATSLRSMGTKQWLALVLCVALMPVNMALEAWKWRTLINDGINGERLAVSGERLSFKEAQRQVYYSKLAGLITPWRLGEYPARGVILVESLELRVERSRLVDSKQLMAKVLAMGAIGSATMTMAIVIAGVVALAFSPAVLAQVGGSYLYALMGVVLILGVCLYFAPQWLQKWFWNQDQTQAQSALIWKSLGQSVVRLGCWCVQLMLVLYALGGLGSLGVLDGLGNSAIYYLLVTITPNVPIAEVGVRGAWAMMLFGTVNAALAGVVLWVINTLLPCLIWIFFRKNTK